MCIALVTIIVSLASTIASASIVVVDPEFGYQEFKAAV